MILAAIGEAKALGARLEKARELLGISLSTIERWRCHPDADDARQGPHRQAHNMLSAHEQARVVAVSSVTTSPENAEISPKQLVPTLADEGIYLASESTMYRLRHRFQLHTKKRSTTRTHVTRRWCTRPAARTRSGAGTSPTSRRRCAAGFCTSTSCSTSGAAASWAGVYERESAELASMMVRDISDEDGIDSEGLQRYREMIRLCSREEVHCPVAHR